MNVMRLTGSAFGNYLYILSAVGIDIEPLTKQSMYYT